MMSKKNIQPEVKIEPDNIQYIYGDEQFSLDHSLDDNVEENENDCNDYYFPDGTRAILVDGQYYIPAETQAIVLQEGQEDLSSYIIKQDCDSIIVNEGHTLSADQEEESQQIIQYVEGTEDDSNQQQIIYYTSADETVNLDEYTATTSDDLMINGEEGSDTMLQEIHQVQTDDDEEGYEYSVEAVNMQQIVDLEDLVKHQNGKNKILVEGMTAEELRQCQYAVLKDGKLHIQRYAPEGEVIDFQTNSFNVLSETSPKKKSEIVDLSRITGRNIITGQTVTLHEYMAKLQKKINNNTEETKPVLAVENRNVRKGDALEPPKIKRQKYDKDIYAKDMKQNSLMTLLNKKIPIGKTTTGKKLVGKIIQIKTKGPGKNTVTNTVKHNRKEAVIQPQSKNTLRNVKQIYQIETGSEAASEYQYLVNVPEGVEIKTLETIDLSPVDNEPFPTKQISSSLEDNSNSFENDHFQAVQMEEELQEITETEPQEAILSTEFDLVANENSIEHSQSQFDSLPNSSTETQEPYKLYKCNVEASDQANNSSHFEKSKKLIVQSHKDTYSDICRTLIGLMEVPTVQKKMCRKNLAVKVIEKRYDPEQGKMTKTAVHIYGYMDSEFQLCSSGDLVQQWKFVPDKDTQDALLAHDSLKDKAEANSALKCCKYEETVVVSLVITYDRSGKHLVKVILNPCSGTRCGICAKEFRTYTQTQTHMLKNHNVNGSYTRDSIYHMQLEHVETTEYQSSADVSEGVEIQTLETEDPAVINNQPFLTEETRSLVEDAHLQTVEMEGDLQELTETETQEAIIDTDLNLETNEDTLQHSQIEFISLPTSSTDTQESLKENNESNAIATNLVRVQSQTSNSDTGEKPIKIIVKSHKISKESYTDICKTLTGLMEMVTIQKKLSQKNLAVKVIEKRYDSNQGKMVKTALHIYGYMDSEFQLCSSGDLVQQWKFVPDKNTQDALLADEVIQEEGDEQKVTKSCKYVETVVINLLITYDRNGKRSVKVILNPSSGTRCTICTKEFKTYTQTQMHMLKAHNVDGSRTRCTLCHTQLEDVEALERHKDEHVSEGRLVRCQVCRETFTSANRLGKHMAQHVPAIKPLECSVCLQRCSNESTLKKHLLLHTGIKLFQCGICNKKYSSQCDLTLHQKVHDPLNFFVCLVCKRKFTRLSNLVRHSEIHKKTGNALFTCEICGASYCFNSSLTRHMVQNHLSSRKT